MKVNVKVLIWFVAIFAAVTVPITIHAAPDEPYWEFRDLEADKTPSLTDVERNARVDLLYYAFSGEPVPYDSLAGLIVPPYAREGDAFRRHEMFGEVKEQIDRQLAYYREHPNFYYESVCNVEQYDFNTSSFPVLDPVNYTHSGLDLLNRKDFQSFKITDVNRAKTISGEIISGGYPVCRFYVHVLGTRGEPRNRTIELKLIKEELYTSRPRKLLAFTDTTSAPVIGTPKLGENCNLWVCSPGLRRWMKLGHGYDAPSGFKKTQVICDDKPVPLPPCE
jgi:hypothetical protein